MEMKCGRGGFVVLVVLLGSAWLLPDAASAKTFLVGGSQNWRLGVNYVDWAARNAPFHVNDTLVFKYGTRPPHTVYMMSTAEDFAACRVTNGVLLAETTQGGGDGFELVLTEAKTYYLACSIGKHCSRGLMKFSVTPCT